MIVSIHAKGSGYEASNEHITMQWVPTIDGRIRSYVKLVGADWDMRFDYARTFDIGRDQTEIEAVQRDWDRVNAPSVEGSHLLPDGTCCHCGPANCVTGPKFACDCTR